MKRNPEEEPTEVDADLVNKIRMAIASDFNGRVCVYCKIFVQDEKAHQFCSTCGWHMAACKSPWVLSYIEGRWRRS